MKYILGFIGVVVLAAIGFLVYTYTPKVGNNAPVSAGQTEPVVVFFTKMTATDEEFVAVPREVPKSNVFETLALETIQELLKGPTVAEKAQGLSAPFNAGTEVNYVKIMDSTLVIDFNSTFDTPMGGSTRVRSIFQMINRTIRQFPLDNITDIQLTVNRGERPANLEP